MAFNKNPGYVKYTSTSEQEIFTFDFKIYTNFNMRIYRALKADQFPKFELVDLNEYEVDINGDNGGTITFFIPQKLGDELVLVRFLEADRVVEYQPNGMVSSEVLNQDQNFQTYLIMDNLSGSGSAGNFYHNEIGFEHVSTTMPRPEANKLLGWNNDMTALKNVDLGMLTFMGDFTPAEHQEYPLNPKAGNLYKLKLLETYIFKGGDLIGQDVNNNDFMFFAANGWTAFIMDFDVDLLVRTDGRNPMKGNLNMGVFNRVVRMAEGTDPSDAINKAQADRQYLQTDGDNTMLDDLHMNHHKVTLVADGTLFSDVPNIGQLYEETFKYVKTDGTNTMLNNFRMGMNRITSVSDGLEMHDAVNFSQVYERGRFTDKFIPAESNPVKTQPDGKIAGSMFDFDLLTFKKGWTPTAGIEYPLNPERGDTYIIELTADYVFTTGDLVGQTVKDGYLIIKAELEWVMNTMELVADVFVRTDGANPMTGDLQMSGNNINGVARATVAGQPVIYEQIADIIFDYVKADGTTVMTGNLQMNNNTINGLSEAVLPSEAVNFGQLQGYTDGFIKLDGSSTFTTNIPTNGFTFTGLVATADDSSAVPRQYIDNNFLNSYLPVLQGPLDCNDQILTNINPSSMLEAYTLRGFSPSELPTSVATQQQLNSKPTGSWSFSAATKTLSITIP